MPFPDRPDVLTRFTVTLEAERTAYPVLLANGNLLAAETLANGRHRATQRWQMRPRHALSAAGHGLG